MDTVITFLGITLGGRAWILMEEDQDALKKFTLQEVLEELEKVKDGYPGKHGGKRKRKHGEELVIYN